MRRVIPHPGLSVRLALVWLLMANSLSFGALLIGIVIGVLLPLFTAPVWPRRPDVRFLTYTQ